VTKAETINILIGAGQLLLAFLLFLGVDKKIVTGKLGANMAAKSWLILLLIIGGWAFSAYSFYLAKTRPDLTSSFYAGELETVSSKSFSGQTIELDGKLFENCTFTQVELVFHGTKKFKLHHNHFTAIGPIKIRTDNPAAFLFLQTFLELEGDNDWHTAFEFTLTDSAGKAISNLIFSPEGYIQLVPKK
jgi:hypothetical protein